jgi:hypothetical protein
MIAQPNFTYQHVQYDFTINSLRNLIQLTDPFLYITSYIPYEKRRGHGYTLVHQLLKTPLLSL